MTASTEEYANTTESQGLTFSSILELNDDCLIKIFSYLTNDQLVSFLGICSRLDEIIHINLRRCKSISFNFRYLDSDMHFGKLFWAAGPHLESIEFSVGYSISTEKVATALKPIVQCSRLKHLTLHYVHMCKDYLHLIEAVANHLEEIDFSFCLLTDELMVNFFERHCVSLKKLCMIGNYTFFGDSLVYLKGLRKLVLESHENFSINMDLVKANNPGCEIIVYGKGRDEKIDINIITH